MSRSLLAGIAGLALVLAAAVDPAAGLDPGSGIPATPLPTDTRERARVVKPWIARAGLEDLVYLLQRPRAELAELERPMIERALRIVPPTRPALRLALEQRRAQLPARGAAPSIKPARAPSVFQVAVLLPDSGAYSDYSQAVHDGIEAGLASRSTNRPPMARYWPSGEDQPALTVAALDSAAGTAGAVIGELLSLPTLAAATAAHYLELPLISPTASDERVGAMGSHVFQVGPSGYERGEILARAVVQPGARIGILTSSSASASFTAGFVTAAEAAGGIVAWRATHADGGPGFKSEAAEIQQRKLDLLFWDGESRDAEGLLRQLARDRVTVRIVGGMALSPAPFHTSARIFLEGVCFVADEWVLPPGLAAGLGTAIAEREGGAPGPLHVRGFLAGRALASAIAGGALCPEETRAALEARRSQNPAARSLGFLDFAADSVSLPVSVVRRGTAVPIVR